MVVAVSFSHEQCFGTCLLVRNNKAALFPMMYDEAGLLTYSKRGPSPRVVGAWLATKLRTFPIWEGLYRRGLPVFFPVSNHL